MDTININELNNGLPTISKFFCGYLAEVTIFCLQYNSHKSAQCILDCIKDNKNNIEKFNLVWEEPDPGIKYTYSDLAEAVEYGATGLAILLSPRITKYPTVARSMKGDGFDYWLGDTNDGLFQNKARLEISGILKGDESQFKSRIKQKFKQTNISDNMGYDCFVSVVEFAKPKASFLIKEKSYG